MLGYIKDSKSHWGTHAKYGKIGGVGGPGAEEIKCWPFFDMASPLSFASSFFSSRPSHAFISLCTIFGLSPAPVMLICTSLCEWKDVSGCHCVSVCDCVCLGHVCGCSAFGILRWCRKSWMMAFAFTQPFSFQAIPPFHSVCVCVRLGPKYC